jgi:hypothetical protein
MRHIRRNGTQWYTSLEETSDEDGAASGVGGSSGSPSP